MSSRRPQLGIDEQLSRIVAGLPVDIDGACIVGRTVVIEPEVVAEPVIPLRECDQLSGASMIEPVCALLLCPKHRLDAWHVLQQTADRSNPGWVANIDVSNLMVGDREGI